MALRILGIDLGASSVKVAEVRSSFRATEVVGLWQARVQAAGATPTLAEQVAALMGLLPASTRADVVVVSVPGTGAATHRLSFPFADTRRLEQTLGFEVEGQIPFDLSEVVYDYEIVRQSTAKGSASTDVLVGVARRTAITELVTALLPAGLDPRIITLPSLGLQSLPLPETGEGGDAILDVGHARLSLLVLEAGRPSAARVFDGGGRALTAALARARHLDLDAAEALKHETSLVSGDPELQQVLTRTLLPAIRDLRQSLRQVESLSKVPVQRLWLTGGGAALQGLDELLGRELGVPARRLPVAYPPAAGVSPDDAAVGALALGLALRGHATTRGPRFNFRRGELGFQGDFARMRGRILRTAALAAALAMCFAVRAYAELYLLGKRERRVEDAICAQTKQTVQKCVKDPTVAKSLLSAAGGTGETVIPEQTAVQLLAEVTSRLGIEGMRVHELDVGLEQIQLRGAADSFETVDKVVSALKSYRCFPDVQRGRVQKSRDLSEIEFTLSVRNECSAGGTP